MPRGWGVPKFFVLDIDALYYIKGRGVLTSFSRDTEALCYVKRLVGWGGGGYWRFGYLFWAVRPLTTRPSRDQPLFYRTEAITIVMPMVNLASFLFVKGRLRCGFISATKM